MMRNPKDRSGLLRIKHVVILMFILCAAFLGYVFVFFRVDNMTINHSYVEEMTQGWNVTEDHTVTIRDFPIYISSSNTDAVIIERIIPRAYWGESMAFYSDHMLVKVYFDDELQYQFGTKDDKSFGKSPGSAWNFVDIPVDLTVGRVRIVVTTPYHEHMTQISKIIIGKRDACTWHVFKKSVFGLFNCFVMVLAGFVLLALGVWLKIARRKTLGMLPLGIMFLLMAAITLIESNLLQFFYGNQYLYDIASSLCMLLLPLPVLLFLRDCYFREKKNLFNRMIIVFSLNAIIALGLQGFSILDFHQQSYLMFGCFVFVVGFLLLEFFKANKCETADVEGKEKSEKIIVFTGFTIELFLLGVDQIYHFEGGNINDVSYSGVGGAVLALTLGLLYAVKVGKIFTDGLKRQAEYYRMERENIAKQNELLYIAKDATERANTVLDQYNKNLEDKVEMKTEEIMRLQQKVIEGFANLIENRDAFTGQHVKRTSAYVNIIIDGLIENEDYLRELEEEYEDYNLIRKAAPLHDIGKIIVPDYVLCKPGRLTPEEFEIIKEHTSASDKIIDECLTGLESVQYIGIAKDMAIYHHERFDGTGYPKGLVGTDIPLCARIMAVADVFDALISKRSYKEPMSFDEAFKILEDSKGTHFDPEIVKIFMEHRGEVEELTNGIL